MQLCGSDRTTAQQATGSAALMRVRRQHTQAPRHPPRRRTAVHAASRRHPAQSVSAAPAAACHNTLSPEQPCSSSSSSVVGSAEVPLSIVGTRSTSYQPQRQRHRITVQPQPAPGLLQLHQAAGGQQQQQQQPQHPPSQQGLRWQLQPQQPQHMQMQLLSENSRGGSGSNKQQPPEPHTASGSPPADASGSSSTNAPDSSNKPAAPTANNSSSSTPATTTTSVEDDVDEALNKMWASLKKDLKKELPPEQASMLDSWSPSDIQTDKVFREMANHQLGPFLQSMGIDEDPYDFFLDLFRLALVFQLAAAGLVFYTMELGLGGNAGDAFRAVGGLLLGYTLRLGIKVEQLAWPVYNGLVQLLINEGATYEIPPASAEEQRDTLNKLGVALAVAFLVPKFAFGWQNDECWQIAVPMLGGLFFFDVAYMFGLLIKLNMPPGGGGGDE